MKISELAELSGGEISRMSNEELTSIIHTAGRNLNKRAKRLEREKLSTFSPAYRSFSAATGGKGRVISYVKIKQNSVIRLLQLGILHEPRPRQ